MEIKVSENVNSTPCEVLVTGKFEGEKTTVELANKYAVDKDHFEGKFCETYLMHTLGQNFRTNSCRQNSHYRTW